MESGQGDVTAINDRAARLDAFLPAILDRRGGGGGGGLVRRISPLEEIEIDWPWNPTMARRDDAWTLFFGWKARRFRR